MNNKKALFSSVLSVLAALSLVGSAAVIGSITSESSVALAPGATYSYKDVKTEKGIEKLYTVGFTLRDDTVEMRLGLTDGMVRGQQRLLDIARFADKDNAVLAGINASFYTTGSAGGGVPYAFMMQDGEWYNNPPREAPGGSLNGNSRFVVAVDKKNHATIEPTPAYTASFTAGGKTTPIAYINRLRQQGSNTGSLDALVLYTHRYAESTYTDAGGLEVCVEVKEDVIRQGAALTGKVSAVSTAGNTALKPGVVVLSATEGGKAPLTGLAVGDTVTFAFGFTDPRWKEMSFATGGAQLLVKNGEILPTPTDEGFYIYQHPRTAVGLKADGSLLWLTVDGRQDGTSEGMSLPMLALLMKEMGCVQVLNMDGGGSATMVARLPGEELTLRNVPSNDGAAQRKLANGLLLVQRKPRPALTTTTTTRPPTTTTTTTAKPTTTTAATTTTTTTTTAPTTTTTMTTTTTTRPPTTITTAATTAATQPPPAAEAMSDGIPPTVWAGVTAVLVLGAAGGVLLYLKKSGILSRK